MVKSPLSFDGTIGVFDDGLSLSVEGFVDFVSLDIFFDVGLVFGAFDVSSFAVVEVGFADAI